MTERVLAENGSPDEHPMRKVLRMYRDAGQRHAAELKRLEGEGRAIVLCPPNCPAIYHHAAEHAHTWWDMYRMAPLAAYECQLKRAAASAQAPGVDIAARLRSAGVGAAQVESMGGKLDERPAFRTARKWWSQPRPTVREADGTPKPGPMPFPWLLLLGDRDTGKSLAAAWALRQYFRTRQWNASPGGMREPPPGVFFPAADLVTLNAVGWSGEEGRDVLGDLRRTPFLVLDDLGAVAYSEHTLGLLYQVLDARYREGRRTVITANLSAQDFERRFDFRGGQRGDGEGSGRLLRRCEERGFIAHLTRRGDKMGGKLTVGGKAVTNDSQSERRK